MQQHELILFTNSAQTVHYNIIGSFSSSSKRYDSVNAVALVTLRVTHLH
jgi:hypothetical protein